MNTKFKHWLYETNQQPEFGLVKSEGTNGPLYTLIDKSRLLQFCNKLQQDYVKGIKDPDIEADDLINNDVVLASVRVALPTDSVVEYYGSCMGATQVKVSAVNIRHKGKRYGELLYNYVFGDNPNGLTPDREDVSPSALKLWKRFASQADVKKVSDQGMSYDTFDNKEDPKTPTKEDDCVIHTSKEKDVLNHAYVMPGTDPSSLLSETDRTLDQCAQILDGLWEKDSLIYMIDNASMFLFDRAMGIGLNEGKLSKYWKKRAAARAKRGKREYPNKIDREWAIKQQENSHKVNSRLDKLYQEEINISEEFTGELEEFLKNMKTQVDKRKAQQSVYKGEKLKDKMGVAAAYQKRSKKLKGATVAPGETTAFAGPMEERKK